MIRVDGSHHDWLEGRCPKMVLMGYIDDATNNVYARFYEYECTIAHDRKLFQTEGRVAAKKVTVEERTDGSMRITGNGVVLEYTEIIERPKKVETMTINRKKLIDSMISSKNDFWQQRTESFFVEKRVSV